MTVTTGAATVRATDSAPETAQELPADLVAIRTATYSTRSPARYCLTSAGAFVVGLAVIALGVGVDVFGSDGPGIGVAVAFLVAAVTIALRLRVRLLLTAVIAPPLLFATGVLAVIYLSGEARGSRQLGLEAATALALSAPLLFAGTALATLIALGRFIEHLVRRRR